jgi:hypothetical protein
MINGNYGIYQGAVHRIGFEPNGKIALSPNSDSEIDDTYVDPYHLGMYTKIIDRTELSEAYSLESYAEYKGYKISIAREVGDEYELYLSDYELAQKLGFDRCDKCGYNLMIKKTDVEVIIEKKPLDL